MSFLSHLLHKRGGFLREGEYSRKGIVILSNPKSTSNHPRRHWR